MNDQLYKVFDASIPPVQAPPGAQGVLGYVGREGFTPHVWTLEEWGRFSHLVQFPAWLPDLSMDPEHDALDAVAAVEALGWARYAEPNTRLILLDGETDTFPAWYATWAAVVGNKMFTAVDYGSESVVLGNAAYDVWAADWNDIPELQPGQTQHGDQYKAGITWEGASIDLSVIDASLFIRGGIGPRR